MIKQNYTRKNDAGFFTPIKRMLVLGAAVSTIAYIGGKTDFDNSVDRYFGKKKPEISIKAAQRNGDLEYTLVYESHGKKEELPVRIGENGIHAGDLDYRLRGIDYGSMSHEQASEHAGKALNILDREKRIELMLNRADAKEYSKSIWNRLEGRQKNEILKAELEKLLK
ncbi:hypothetical protein HYU11_04230 [Candidatus Woesearchaeota archaeon]|nr:hypothetical protein [Candidatus Woesearchaeota archaeon]